MAKKHKNKQKESSARKKESMVDKAQVKIGDLEEGSGRKAVGMGFALVGFLLILGVVVLNILNTTEPKLDEELSVPSLNDLEEFTKEDRISVSGKVEDVSQVIIYVNEKMLTTVAEVEDGKFEIEYVFTDEGEYVFEAVSVEGFPFRKGSEKSNSVSIIVDWTPPTADIKLEYEAEVNDGLGSVSGEAEPNITLRLLDGEEEVASVETDEEGLFDIQDIKLEEGENEFRVELEDRAGNRNVLARRVTILSPVDAPEEISEEGLLGTGGDIPEASGDLFRVLDIALNHNLISLFGFLSLVALVISSTGVWIKMRRG